MNKLLETGSEHLAAFGHDWRDEAAWLGRLVVYAIVGLVLAGFALIAASAWVIVAFWDSHRLLACGAVTAVYVLGALTMAALVRARIASRPKPFPDTLAQLERDRAKLNSLWASGLTLVNMVLAVLARRPATTHGGHASSAEGQEQWVR